MIHFVYHPDDLPVKELYLVGSWNDEGDFCPQWSGQPIPMKAQPDGSYGASAALPTEHEQDFYWGVKDQNQHWMLFEHEAQKISPESRDTQVFRLGNRHRLGLHRHGEDGFRATFWAPKAQIASFLVQTEKGPLTWPMELKNDFWEVVNDTGWRAIEGLPYGLALTTSCGQTVLRNDPYARVRQGPQRGVHDLFLTAEGEFAHRYQTELIHHHALRFEASPPRHGQPQAPPVLKLYRDGKQLDRKQLETLCAAKPTLPSCQTWWTSHVKPDGSIPLEKEQEAQSFSICIGPENQLRGLSYTLEDADRSYHDPWTQVLDGHHNWPRLGLVKEATRAHPSKLGHPEDIVFYEMHIGSILGKTGNLRSSNFAEVSKILPKIKKLGFTALALMPTNATEGWRDWGYLGTSTLAHQEAYSDPGMHADESLVSFVNKAHELGLRVFFDVVYNHVGGFHNDLWEFDGLENSWFERSEEALGDGGPLPRRPYDTVQATPRTQEPSVRETPWGPVPAFNKAVVRQFYIDHAMDQVERLGADGIRFDFTHLIHSTGAGDSEGWAMLRAIHQRLKYFFPHVLTFAEEFPPNPILTTAVEEGGAGFSGMWNTEHQHRLVFDHHWPSVTQNMVEGGQAPLAHFLDHLTFPKGFSTPCTSATVLSNHDEVGNAHRLYQLVKTHPRGLDMARLVSWFSLLCPGYPILFQGTEDLASNYFSWGLPHTWDVTSHLLGEPQQAYRAQHLKAIEDVLNYRAKSPGLWAQHRVHDHYLDEHHQILAIRRSNFWIVGNFGPSDVELPEHLHQNARLVLNSEKKKYGYLGRATRGGKLGSYTLKVWQH